MENKSDFWLTDEEGKDSHFTLLGYTENDDRVYVIATPFEKHNDYKDYQEARIAIFLLSYVSKKPHFELVTNTDMCKFIFDKFSDEHQIR